MTDNNHPITPPPELVQQWFFGAKAMPAHQWVTDVATQAARWGADMELVACCEWLVTGPYGFSIEATAPSLTKRLRAARRPEPPSLNHQKRAAVDLNHLDDVSGNVDPAHVNGIRRAKERHCEPEDSHPKLPTPVVNEPPI